MTTLASADRLPLRELEVFKIAKSAMLISMIDLLKKCPGISVNELATHFDRSPRSIYRWLNEICAELRMPVYCRNGGYYLSDPPQNRCVDLSPQELLALRLCLNSRIFGADSPLQPYARSAWEKIRDGAHSEELESAGNLAAKHAIGVQSPAKADPRVLRLIEHAVNEHRRLHATYRSQKSNQVKDYLIDPYALVFRRHGWYVLAYSHEHDKVIQMRLGRFHAVEETGECFQAPVGFSVEDYFRWSWEAWGGGDPIKVRVRFEPSVASMIEETVRHPTQVVYGQEDGSLIFEAQVSSIEEFGIWVLGYGRSATALEPESLVAFVKNHVLGLIENYKLAQTQEPPATYNN